jgi:tRNA(Ile)-lysidine synthase
MNNIENVVHTAAAQFPNNRYLLSVSGGIDSMVLLALFHKLKLSFEVAHVNYQLRGNESEQDQDLVQKYCSERNITFHLNRADLQKKLDENGGNLQQEARKIRYNFFRSLLENRSLNCIVTAHHQDDQIETFWLMLSRSAGITGLSGMESFSKSIFRPLLPFSKIEILEWAESNKVEWREDRSNSSNNYQRNVWRNKLLPYLQTEIPTLNDSVLLLMHYFKEENNEQKTKVQKYIADISNTSFITLRDYDQLTIHQLVILFNYFKIPLQLIPELTKIRFAQKGKSLVIHASECSFKQLIKEENGFYFKSEESRSLEPKLTISKVASIPKVFTKDELFLDLDKISGDLKLRRWEKGDKIDLIGTPGSKLVSDILTDAKVPNNERGNQFVLIDDKHVIACWGFAIGRNCIASSTSTSVISVRKVH